MSKKTYKLVSIEGTVCTQNDSKQAHFERLVSEHLNNGWVPVGPPVYVGSMWHQAMTFEEGLVGVIPDDRLARLPYPKHLEFFRNKGEKFARFVMASSCIGKTVGHSVTFIPEERSEGE